MSKIAFIGTGAWASALATVLSKNNHQVCLWGIDETEINDINKGYNSKYFGKTKFNNPQLVHATNDLKLALNDAETIVLAVPTPVITSVLHKIKETLGERSVNVINVSKGIDKESKQFFSKIISEIMSKNLKNICSLIGPSFAIEVFNNHLTLINAVGKNTQFLDSITKLFNNDTFKLITNNDEDGSEVYSALKNVLAIGIGIASALYPAKNLAPALISIGLKEIKDIALTIYPQSNPLSGYELSAIGDIVLTCLNTTSRNYSFGLQVASVGVVEALSLNTKTVEGYNTAKILIDIFEKYPLLNTPLLKNIVNVLDLKIHQNDLLSFFAQI
ncbi:glycerol-3-phosphate dehydrogenase [Mycoplasmopsis mucosicanis]|uniref:Glycerol-3-phosphate dehydrogenase n=1 Tax=Mycoplasmopsis mucosicanis TaxID=458208 RepID=A0A507SUR7_9BACT|nr:NAD(P)H-dependent glycerol-3-phosphate dehydrogenase [Mycoplasmopsis mucosicanis]TQC53965.1 glycerol-3-phosphate dehydrogenase [Mycoplasmopsis mucosicanis]